MVYLTAILKSTERHLRKKGFIDSLRLLIKAGSGGHGFPKYGGIGGEGGDIFVEGKEGITLKDTYKKNPTKCVVAGHGENSMKNRILGVRGGDVNIKTPIGVTLYDDKGKSLGEINKEGDKILVAKGGKGGDKASGYSGRKGQKFVLTMDLKLIADVGLVGFPNAGKSTLLSIISRAKPKIASYPFTTVRPSIGILEYPDLRQISMADLPGLIEGAHANVGMGHKFLKHVERTKLLLLVVDVTGFQLGPMYKARSGLETLILLNKELELYKEELLDKPAILVVNKMDKVNSDEEFQKINFAAKDLSAAFDDMPEFYRPNRPITFNRILSMSAGANIPHEVEALRSHIRDVMDETSLGNNEDDVKLFESIDNEYKKAGPLMI